MFLFNLYLPCIAPCAFCVDLCTVSGRVNKFNSEIRQIAHRGYDNYLRGYLNGNVKVSLTGPPGGFQGRQMGFQGPPQQMGSFSGQFSGPPPQSQDESHTVQFGRTQPVGDSFG